MGFVKFARVFRFIGLFLGLNVLAYGLILMFIDKIPGIEDTLAQSAQGTGYTLEELLQTWKAQGLVIAIAGGALLVFGIVCFIIYGANKDKLYETSSPSNYSKSDDNYDYNYDNGNSNASSSSNVVSNSSSKISSYKAKYYKSFSWIADKVISYYKNSSTMSYVITFKSSSKQEYLVDFVFYCTDSSFVNQEWTDELFKEICEILNNERADYGLAFSPGFEINVSTEVGRA